MDLIAAVMTRPTASLRVQPAVAEAAIPRAAAVETSNSHDVRLGAEEAAMSAALAARAIYDPRMTGATETVTSFDRMARVIEGFEHLREIFAANVEQAAEDFGTLATNNKTGGAPATALLDLRM